MPMSRTWNGMGLQEKIDRASGRAIIAVGMEVAIGTKQVCHVITGDLKRSVHVAEIGYSGGESGEGTSDADTAQVQDMLMSTLPAVATPLPMGVGVEVGSWMPYACVEWVGRQHPGVTQGLEMARGGRLDMIVRQAFLEEGLV